MSAPPAGNAMRQGPTPQECVKYSSCTIVLVLAPSEIEHITMIRFSVLFSNTRTSNTTRIPDFALMGTLKLSDQA